MRATPRRPLAAALDEVFAEPIDSAIHLDSVESKLFGIGSESHVVGSHEFCPRPCFWLAGSTWLRSNGSCWWLRRSGLLRRRFGWSGRTRGGTRVVLKGTS